VGTVRFVGKFVPICAIKNVANLEFGWGSNTGKVLCVIMKLHLRGQDRVGNCYEWQINYLKVGRWAEKLKKEIEKLGLAYRLFGRVDQSIR
jgi:hypothetical protein